MDTKSSARVIAEKRIVEILREELKRQYNDPDSTLGWYSESVDDAEVFEWCAVDGNLDLEKMAEAILSSGCGVEETF